MENKNVALTFLRKSSESLPTKNSAQKLLKLFYLSRANNEFRKTYKTSSSKEQQGDCSLCAYFQMETKDGNYHIKIKPKRNKNKKLQKMVSNFETKGEIKASRKKYIQRYRPGVNSVAIFTCSVCKCKKNTLFRKLDKTKVPNQCQPKEEVTTSVNINQLQLVRKKKKDKFAGLKVASAGSSSSSTTTVQAINKIVPSKIQNKSIHIKKSNKNKNKIGKKIKEMAETKQRNNILLLANVLKLNKNSQITSNKNLKSMLK